MFSTHDKILSKKKNIFISFKLDCKFSVVSYIYVGQKCKELYECIKNTSTKNLQTYCSIKHVLERIVFKMIFVIIYMVPFCEV